MTRGVLLGRVSTESRAATYVRVSTDKQDLEAQAADLAGYAAGVLHADVVQEYREKETATGRAERREYDRMLRDARDPDRRWDILLVQAVDRFSREARYERAVVAIHDLEARGVVVRFRRDPECDTPEAWSFTREILLAIKLLMARQEADTILARTQLAMDELKSGRRRTRSGKPVGRPRRVTGEKAARILRLRASGMPYADIARAVGLPSGTCRKVVSVARSQPSAFPTVEAEGGRPA